MGNQKTQELSEIKRNLIMAKHRYTIRVKKVVIYDEKDIEVIASSELDAFRKARKEAEYRNWVDVDEVHYQTQYISQSCNPVEE